jgi:adenylate kinase family enzyme
MKLTLIRGLPGSGKSTIARDISYRDHCTVHCETDNYWIRHDGVYDFNKEYLKNAHAWCQQLTKHFLLKVIQRMRDNWETL